MKRIFVYSLLLVASSLLAQAQTFKFDFSSDKKEQEGFTKITPSILFNNDSGYGYDFQPAWDGKSNAPFFFSVNVPDGNYRVTVTLGSKVPQFVVNHAVFSLRTSTQRKENS